MRIIKSSEISDAVEKICIEANCRIGADVIDALNRAKDAENGETAKKIFANLIRNAEIAADEDMPVCQDCGMAVFFVKLGQEVIVEGETIEDAINEGVRRGYENGYLRKSVVKDPLRRVNTRDNTPAIVHISTVSGDKLEITVAPKGFGSENMSAIKMLKPSDGERGVKEFIVDTVRRAGANPCPPIVVGVGIGGDFEKCALLAKEALTLPLDAKNPDAFYADMESELLDSINALGIGAQGLGGKTTALAVHILPYPTHIAGLPVAVNICCHVYRHKTVVL